MSVCLSDCLYVCLYVCLFCVLSLWWLADCLSFWLADWLVFLITMYIVCTYVFLSNSLSSQVFYIFYVICSVHDSVHMHELFALKTITLSPTTIHTHTYTYTRTHTHTHTHTKVSASVAFESVEYSVQESSRVAEVCISVLRPSVVEREFVLFLTSTDGDASKY